MSTPVFVERVFAPPASRDDVLEMAAKAGTCLNLYGVSWRGSYLAEDGSKMLCHFDAVDAESVRMAMRQSGAVIERVWSGTVHDAPGAGAVNVVVEREFDEPASMEALQAIEDAGAHCLQMHGVTFIRTFFSSDQKRMMCLYQAPDAESVRVAQRQAQMPLKTVWTCSVLHSPQGNDSAA